MAENEHLPIHVEVYIAARILSQQKPEFSKREMEAYIKDKFNDTRPGVAVHIAAVCVANAKLNHPMGFNYLFRVKRGVYRLFNTATDSPHKTRVNCKTAPDIDQLPEAYRYLLSAQSKLPD